VNQESFENQRERYDDRNENRTKGHLGLRKDRVHGEDRSGDVRHTTAQRITARDKHVMGMGTRSARADAQSCERSRSRIV